MTNQQENRNVLEIKTAATYDEFVSLNKCIIDGIIGQINSAVPSAASQEVLLCDLHWELVDEMASKLGSAAANESSDDAQESALDQADAWVASNLSSGGTEADIAMALFLRGAGQGVTALQEALDIPTLTVPSASKVVPSTPLNGESKVKCSYCEQPAVAEMPQSFDQGKTYKHSRCCANHRSGWWDGADWDGRHLEVDLLAHKPLQMGREWLSTLGIGDEVFWSDPDEGLCSGHRIISEIVSDSGKIESDETVVRLAHNGSVTEAFASEISTPQLSEA